MPFRYSCSLLEYFHHSDVRTEFLLWIFHVFVLSCVCYVFVRVCLYVLCGHLLGKGWPLGSRLWCLTVSLALSHWYPGSGVVLDCIDSWSLHRTYFLHWDSFEHHWSWSILISFICFYYILALSQCNLAPLICFISASIPTFGWPT